MSSNLPPGVRDCDIPGNREEDVAWEEFFDWAASRFLNLPLREAYRAVEIGIEAVVEERDALDRLLYGGSVAGSPIEKSADGGIHDEGK